MPPAPTSRPRTFHHSGYSAEGIARARGERGWELSVCLPARQCAGTVGQIVAALMPLREAEAIDRIVVVDAASPDGTAQVAERAGAEVWQEAELLPEFGPVLGKGDAMWRALSKLRSEGVCFLDADSERFSARFATGLLGALVCEPEVDFVKAFYRRPLAAGEGGGRVNHLMARPALALLYPELSGVRQPLAGEVAARRELLERLPFVTGYGVETAMLIDAWGAVGLERMAQVDLEEHHNRHQPLSALSPMAQTVLATALDRARRDGRLSLAGPGDGAGPGEDAEASAGEALAAAVPLERPPLTSLRVR